MESVLLEHPGVAESALVGTPSEAAGELPTAFVVVKPGANVTEKDIIDFAATRVNSCILFVLNLLLQYNYRPRGQPRVGDVTIMAW